MFDTYTQSLKSRNCEWSKGMEQVVYKGLLRFSDTVHLLILDICKPPAVLFEYDSIVDYGKKRLKNKFLYHFGSLVNNL